MESWQRVMMAVNHKDPDRVPFDLGGTESSSIRLKAYSVLRRHLVLPHGTTREVRDEVKRRIDDLAPGGGFVFATVHNIQEDVPVENIIVLWETLREYGVY
jgi:Uroporphyrinogen decarboxylase (URO-D)